MAVDVSSFLLSSCVNSSSIIASELVLNDTCDIDAIDRVGVPTLLSVGLIGVRLPSFCKFLDELDC